MIEKLSSTTKPPSQQHEPRYVDWITISSCALSVILFITAVLATYHGVGSIDVSLVLSMSAGLSFSALIMVVLDAFHPL